jgi:inner membrane protein
MDSLTHILTGVAVGQVFSKEDDKFKPLVLGAIAGNIPDLDVVFQPFLSPESSMLFHRGFSHSLLLWIICSPLLALAVNRIYKGDRFSYFKWLKISATAWFSHLFLDIFNTYGTGLFEPFSHARISYDAVNVYDLVLSVPVLTALIFVVFIVGKYSRKVMIASIALSFLMCYIAFSVITKLMVENAAKTQLVENGIYPKRLISSPLPLSNLAWKVVAENGDGYCVGIYYGFWKDKAGFEYLPKNQHLEEDFVKYADFQKLKRFTKDWYVIEQTNGETFLHDLRFSSLNPKESALYFPLYIENNSLKTGRTYLNRHISFKNINECYKRLKSSGNTDKLSLSF